MKREDVERLRSAASKAINSLGVGIVGHRRGRVVMERASEEVREVGDTEGILKVVREKIFSLIGEFFSFIECCIL